MDHGNKKGTVGRWDFDTQEEYSDYMNNKEALPKVCSHSALKANLIRDNRPTLSERMFTGCFPIRSKNGGRTAHPQIQQREEREGRTGQGMAENSKYYSEAESPGRVIQRQRGV